LVELHHVLKYVVGISHWNVMHQRSYDCETFWGSGWFLFGISYWLMLFNKIEVTAGAMLLQFETK